MSSSSKLVRTVALIATGHLILPCDETLELQKKSTNLTLFGGN